MRKFIGFLFIITVLSWFQPLTLCADLYIWTDESGVKHYANEPPAGNQDVRQETENVIDPGLQKEQDKKRSRLQDEMIGKVPVGSDESVTRNPGKVVMFTRFNESHSRQLRNFFKKYKITYTDYIIDKDEEAKRRFEMTDGTSVPLVFVGSRSFYGCNYELLYRLFGIRDATGAIRNTPY